MSDEVQLPLSKQTKSSGALRGVDRAERERERGGREGLVGVHVVSGVRRSLRMNSFCQSFHFADTYRQF